LITDVFQLVRNALASMSLLATHLSLSNAVKQASIADPFESSMTIGGVGESITATMLPTSKQSQRIQQRTLT